MNDSGASDPFATLAGFIERHWDDARHHQPEDQGGLLGLPHPYFLGCRRPVVRHLITSDLLFANEGLLALGRHEEARGQIANLAHISERLGLVPATNLVRDRAQPAAPLLGLIADRYLRVTGDESVRRLVRPALEIEVEFWRRRRLLPCGLNHAGPKRGNTSATAALECAWRYGPRFAPGAALPVPVDLNALLHQDEQFLASCLAHEAERTAAARLATAAARRAEQMRRLLWDEDTGVFRDSLAEPATPAQAGLPLPASVFHPVWLATADSSETRRILSRLPRFEGAHGLAATERPAASEAGLAWPEIQFIAISALQTAGRVDTAGRLARRYLACVTSNLRTTGDLWPAHDAGSGNVPSGASSVLPGAMGPVAGVCAALIRRLRSFPPNRPETEARLAAIAAP